MFSDPWSAAQRKAMINVRMTNYAFENISLFFLKICLIVQHLNKKIFTMSTCYCLNILTYGIELFWIFEIFNNWDIICPIPHVLVPFVIKKKIYIHTISGCMVMPVKPVRWYSTAVLTVPQTPQPTLFPPATSAPSPSRGPYKPIPQIYNLRRGKPGSKITPGGRATFLLSTEQTP